jgi:ElaA protein
MKNALKTSTHYMQAIRFAAMTVQQFYLVAKLRQDVFIVEQHSIYTDLDGLDQEAMHYLCWSSQQTDAELIGYARYRQLPSSLDFKIERVVFCQAWRGKGIGTLIMRTMLQDINGQCEQAQIKLSAQIEAQSFYQNLGFFAQGDSYDDGGIEHITMSYGR